MTGLPEHNPLSDQVYRYLKDLIINRRLLPGARLKHQQIAEALGVSNTPVREAIRVLEKDGLVESIPYKGTVVKALSGREVGDLYDVRIALERLAARLAVDRISDAQLEAMEVMERQYVSAYETEDVALALEADLEFHDLLAQASGNQIILAILRGLTNRVQVLRQLDRGKVRRRQSLEDHKAILEALRERDVTKVEGLVGEHIEKGKRHVLRLLLTKRYSEHASTSMPSGIFPTSGRASRGKGEALLK